MLRVHLKFIDQNFFFKHHEMYHHFFIGGCLVLGLLASEIFEASRLQEMMLKHIGKEKHLPFLANLSTALVQKAPENNPRVSEKCITGTGCSINIVFFFQEFLKVCHLSLASTAIGCTKMPVNRSDCTLALRWKPWRSLTAMHARNRLQWIVKKHNFSWTPCTSFHWIPNDPAFFDVWRLDAPGCQRYQYWAFFLLS